MANVMERKTSGMRSAHRSEVARRSVSRTPRTVRLIVRPAPRRPHLQPARDFPDEWYTFQNSEPETTARAVRLAFARSDRPASPDGPRLDQVVLHHATRGHPLPTLTVSLRRARGEARTMDGLISTRRGNATAREPLGQADSFGECDLSFEAAAGPLSMTAASTKCNSSWAAAGALPMADLAAADGNIHEQSRPDDRPYHGRRALRGIGESFSAGLYSASGNLTVPIACRRDLFAGGCFDEQ
jgi:hypothetical protein